MPAGLLFAIALLAELAAAAPTAPPPAGVSAAPVYGPIPPTPPRKPVKAADDPVKAATACAPAALNPRTGEIVVCAQRPQGYRLDPDVLEAKRAMRGGGRPRRPERMRDNSCATIGPMGCRGGAGINLLAAAITAATMAARLSKGQEIGSMFVTDPQLTEYQLYQEAKHRREAKEAEAAAVAKAKAKGAGQVHGKAVVEGMAGNQPSAAAQAQAGPAQ